MKKNEEYIVECLDLTRLGYGVVKIDDMIVFVPDLLPQEKALVKIIKVNKTYAIGKVIERYTQSKHRIQPKCSIFPSCGGCQLQHMDYEMQLKTKQAQVQAMVDHSALPLIEVKPTLGMKEPWFYRNKAQFPVQVQNDQIFMGFYRSHSNTIVPCQTCAIQDEMINQVYLCIQQHISFKLAKSLRHILIRHAQSTNQIQIVYIGRQFQDFSKLNTILLNEFPSIVSIVYNENTRNDNVILGNTYSVLYGTDSLIDTCMDNQVKLHFKSFFQVNPQQMEVLYQYAIDAAHLHSQMTCIDMYSGTGTIGMAISKYVKQVIGVEIVKEAVENAQENAKMNGITNCQFICQDASDFVKEYASKNKNVDVIFIDPPRKGMSLQGIHDVCTLAPKQVIYISCNPETLIRDSIEFSKLGYQCQSIQPVDMFCQTISLECVAVFQRNNE